MNSIAKDLLGTQKEIRDMLLEIGGKGSLLSTDQKKKKTLSIFYSYVESRTYKHMGWF